MSGVGEDHGAEICEGLIQTSNARCPEEDTRSSQVACREDGTDQGAKFNPPAAAHGDPRKFPQDLESPGGASGNSPSTSSTGPSPSADTVSPLITSIPRILPEDPSHSAQDTISAIQKRSDAKTVALSGPDSEHAINDALTSEAAAGQESTSNGTKRRPIGTSGRPRSQANKKQKTCAPSEADGDDEDGSEDGEGDSDGGGGGGGDGPPPTRTPRKPFEGWMCPYCLHYVEITCVKDFESCGRPGFCSRNGLRNHLRRLHSPEVRPKNVSKSLAQYYMNPQQWEDVKKVMNNTKRRQKKKYPQEWLQVQTTCYRKMFAIIFPGSQCVPDSPFHTSKETLKERCYRVVEALMNLEYDRTQARDCSSREDIQLFTRPRVQEMLGMALYIGLESLPIAAQHFGIREAVEATHTEPQTGAVATTPTDKASEPAPDGSDVITPSTEAAAAETEGSSTPRTPLPRVPKAVTPQASPLQNALDAQQTLPQKSSDAPLEINGETTVISIGIKPRNNLQATDQAPVARVQVTAPSTFSVNIEKLRDLGYDDFGV